VAYAVYTARTIFRDAERVADEGEQRKIAEWAIHSRSLERLKATWTLAKADLVVSPKELDTDPMLLNVENGTVDLRTGSLRPHLLEDLITKLAPVEFDPKAKAPRFLKFLLKQALVDDELIAFVQRFLGYSLTGWTEERTLAVLYGVGKNGKSTLVELFQDLLGDYAGVANPNTIMHQRYGDSTAQYQLAELVGKRFVSVSETKRGVELEEAAGPRRPGRGPGRSRVAIPSAPARRTASRSPTGRSSRSGCRRTTSPRSPTGRRRYGIGFA
jgi:putative DNA primase/helicase